MPRRARSRNTLVFRVRAWFGLQQDELALYLGVSKATVQAMESQRFRIGPAVSEPLFLLLAQLPPAVPATAETMAMPLPLPPTELPPDSAAPEAAELDFRRRVCLYQAVGLQAQADKLALQAAIQVRWAQALPALLAAYPAPTEAALAADPDAGGHHTWLIGWLTRHARLLPTADITRWHLLQARLAARRAEAASLAAALAADTPHDLPH
ncbi:antitoxin Xre-like helix-turn-helix domain-containing protein [Hymenobacter elongatus]|uniref:Antitoxin Xre-like helix-turn-helix domain-containing protein n=1 Tax=Hymenobacter elongatus TaxID=877208 RepID=A0A4Z0PF01_9BACT|nr:antitoxin Xre-like helix-turn-helix domain-containing protein [Hymenobacter elongatus]TGE13410.1 hypothetical protein E5J99_19490 [Hymenobacter elongatus]